MFHFRIKSDKKPNGTKISAVQHVEYINREGKFSTPEQWQQKNKFVSDFISSEKFPNAFGGQNFLLYKTDDFGSIRNSQRGIKVTQNASEETIATALVLASHLMNHQPLIINGSDNFKKAVLKTAVQKDLPISFDDLSFQNDFLLYKEVDYPDRKNFALHTAQKILQHIAKTNAQSHLEYINRERAFENCGACIFHSHYLPKWAHDDPKKFFQVADKYEGVGHRRYVEIEFALPNELKTVEQYRQIIDAFIAKHLSDHYYAYAIHDKIGLLSGQRHPHVHIMFSERLIDDVEKSRNVLLMLFSSIRHERKKMALNLPLRRNGNVVLLKTASGAIINMLQSFAPTLPIFKMRYWSKMAFPFALTIVPLKPKKKKPKKTEILLLPDFLVVCRKNMLVSFLVRIMRNHA